MKKLLLAALLAAAPAAAQLGERPSVGTGQSGRWWLTIRTNDGRVPEMGPFATQADCERALDGVVADVRRTNGDRLAFRTRERATCSRR